jgi:DNA invertase Pin-like site-specific DNA recombinase
MTEATKNKLSIANTGQMHPQAKLTDALVRQIRKRLDQGMGVRELAKELGLSHTIISQVGTKKRWGHVAP